MYQEVLSLSNAPERCSGAFCLLILIEHFLIGTYPRSHGENLGDDALSATPTGASPLTRGKPRGEGAPCVPEGLIPAHAGKTPPPSPHTPRSLGLIPAHAGENLPLSWEPPMLVGSSPLTRGKHVECEQIPRLQGLIPAHAGKTSCARGRGPFARAHPHSCGENPRLQACRALALGSSPLTRGKHGDGLLVDFQHGIIPAHAGKTRRQGR